MTLPYLLRWTRRPAIVALVIGAVGVGYRLFALLVDMLPANSDEAVHGPGLAAHHVRR